MQPDGRRFFALKKKPPVLGGFGCFVGC